MRPTPICSLRQRVLCFVGVPWGSPRKERGGGLLPLLSQALQPRMERLQGRRANADLCKPSISSQVHPDWVAPPTSGTAYILGKDDTL